jgi:hypothetical protein
MITKNWSKIQKIQYLYIYTYIHGAHPPTDGIRVEAKCRTEVKAPSGSLVPFFAASQYMWPRWQPFTAPCISSGPGGVGISAAIMSGLPVGSFFFRVTTIQMDNTSIIVDASSGIFRPLLPATFRRPVFDAIHSLAHPGIRTTRRLIASQFVWPCLLIAAWCRDCTHCQRAMVLAQPSSPPLAIVNPTQQFSHLHVDLVGPLPQYSSSYSHLFTVVDRSTCWAEAIPLRSTTARGCTNALFNPLEPGQFFFEF